MITLVLVSLIALTAICMVGFAGIFGYRPRKNWTYVTGITLWALTWPVAQFAGTPHLAIPKECGGLILLIFWSVGFWLLRKSQKMRPDTSQK